MLILKSNFNTFLKIQSDKQLCLGLSLMFLNYLDKFFTSKTSPVGIFKLHFYVTPSYKCNTNI